MKIKAGINTTRQYWNYVFSPETRAGLAEYLDFDETLLPDEASVESIAESVRGAEVILATWGALPYTEEILAACPDLKLILYAAGAFKAYITDALLKRDVVVCTSVHLNAVPTAEFALGMILTSLKNAWGYRERFRTQGRAAWQVDRERFNGGYFHTRVGLIGFGRISRHLMKLLANFDMEVFIYSEHMSSEDEQRYGARRATLEWIMANCDVVSLHAADVPRNWNLINRDNLKLMKPGARLINTARGRLINEADLVERLESGEISAYLDVTEPEPPEEGHPFYRLANCVLTPHVAGSIGTEVHRMGEYCLRELENWMRGDPLENRIDLTDQDERA